jgi:hypothetical protein
VEGATVEVEGNMRHAGMVPVFGSALEGEAGTYVVPDFTFTMAGDWVLSLQAALPDGRQAHLQRGTKVYSAPPGIPSDTGQVPNAETQAISSSEGTGQRSWGEGS